MDTTSAEPRSILIDGRSGWGNGYAVDVGTLGDRGLHLAGRDGVAVAIAGAPAWLAAPAWADGSPDVPPALLGTDGVVRRADAFTATVMALVAPEDLGVAAAELVAVATSRADIYLLDARGSRVLVVTCRGDLRDVLAVPAGHRAVALCGLPEGAAVLIEEQEPTTPGRAPSAAIQRHRSGESTLDDPGPPLPSGQWTRCAAGRDERVWVVDERASTAVAVDANGRVQLRTADGPGLQEEIGARGVEVRAEACVLLPGLLGPVDRSGRPVTPARELTPPTLPRAGRWISAALDSVRYRCQWHRLRVRTDLPPHTSLRLSTYTAPEAAAAATIAVLPESEWRRAGPNSLPDGESDVLVLSGPGRFLWVRAELGGDGYTSPALAAVRAEFPRRSLARFLPAVYAADPRSADFLDRFLAIPATVLDDWDVLLRELPRHVDPRATPDRFVNLLASWIGVPVEGRWTAAQQRRLVLAARHYLTRRGTSAGIRAHVAAYLGAMSAADHLADDRADDSADHSADDSADAPTDELPQLVEGFAQRQYRTLADDGTQGRPLWSLGRVARLQTDRFDELGRVRLVAGGDPQLDLYTEHAHRFAVLVPASAAATPEARAMLRRAIAQESPAHVRADLVPVHPAMCLGVQSQLGLDTALSVSTPVRLLCTAAAKRFADEGEEPPGPRLGPRAVLGGAHTDLATVGSLPSGDALLAVS